MRCDWQQAHEISENIPTTIKISADLPPNLERRRRCSERRRRRRQRRRQERRVPLARAVPPAAAPPSLSLLSVFFNGL